MINVDLESEDKSPSKDTFYEYMVEYIDKVHTDIGERFEYAHQKLLKYFADTGNEAEKMIKTQTMRRFVEDHLGYPLEKHVYTTEDGYINTVFRIPGKKGSGSTLGQKGKEKKPVVIYQHGILDCCIGIIANEEESLGLKLVNAGYDLWMNNSRGNRFSRDHQTIDVDHSNWERVYEYWDFSYQELASYD